jgi:predicted transcriptional regulator
LEKDPSSNKSSILEIVALVPGIHLREVARALGVSLNTVRYHVQILSKTGLISCSNEGGYSRLFPAGTSSDQKSIYCIMRNRTARKILAVLAKEGGLTNKKICQLTGLAKSTVSEHVQTFLVNHLVNLQTSDYGGPVIGLVEPDLVRGIILSQSEKAKRIDLVENYVDLWDF